MGSDAACGWITFRVTQEYPSSGSSVLTNCFCDLRSMTEFDWLPTTLTQKLRGPSCWQNLDLIDEPVLSTPTANLNCYHMYVYTILIDHSMAEKSPSSTASVVQ